MGMAVEFNWFLVTEEGKYSISDQIITVEKLGPRIYPVNAEIPLVIKTIGCTGLVRILEFSVNSDRTQIQAEIVEHFNEADVVAQNYYKMYLKRRAD